MISLLEILLQEDFLGNFQWGGSKYEWGVYQNPKSIKKFAPECRAISDPKGNLYVVDDGWNVTHSLLAQWLDYNGYSISQRFESEESWLKRGYIAWHRVLKTDIFYLGESYEKWEIEDNFELLTKYVKKIKSKNSRYTFELRKIWG